MKAQCSSTAGTDTWIVDVMQNDTVITSAEAGSEEEAMTKARTSAHVFYGSRAAMFEYTVYPPSPRIKRTEVDGTEESVCRRQRQQDSSQGTEGVRRGKPRRTSGYWRSDRL